MLGKVPPRVISRKSCTFPDFSAECVRNVQSICRFSADKLYCLEDCLVHYASSEILSPKHNIILPLVYLKVNSPRKGHSTGSPSRRMRFLQRVGGLSSVSVSTGSAESVTSPGGTRSSQRSGRTGSPSPSCHGKMSQWFWSKQWKKEQASRCCTAHVCLRQSVNQLYNNQKRPNLFFFHCLFWRAW